MDALNKYIHFFVFRQAVIRFTAKGIEVAPYLVAYVDFVAPKQFENGYSVRRLNRDESFTRVHCDDWCRHRFTDSQVRRSKGQSRLSRLVKSTLTRVFGVFDLVLVGLHG